MALIDTETDTETERTPLLAGTPTPTTATPARPPAFPIPPASGGNPITHDSSDSGDEDGNNDDDDGAAPDPLAHLRAVLRPRVILLVFAILFVVELGAGMIVPPTNAIMESIICRRMHPEVFSPPPFTPPPPPPSPSGVVGQLARLRHIAGGIVLADDPVCKSPDVQGYLAMLRGWAATFDAIPGIVGAVPYGILSDRWGRKGVLALSLGGFWVGTGFGYGVYYFSDVVPLWVSWFSSLFQL